MVGNYSSREKAVSESKRLTDPKQSDYVFVDFYIVKTKLDDSLVSKDDDEDDYLCTCTSDGMTEGDYEKYTCEKL